MDIKDFITKNNRFIIEGTPYSEFTAKPLGIPNSKGIVRKIKRKDTKQHPGKLVYEFKINFNSDGLRNTPINSLGRSKHAIFFGDSQIIGEGVNDNETIPYYFSNINKDYTPYNYGFFGNSLPEALNIVKSVEFQSKFRNKTGEVIYTYRDDINTYCGNIDDTKKQIVLIKKINHLLRNISKQLNFTVVLLPLSFSSRSLYKQLIDNCINVVNLFFIDTGFLTNDKCRFLDGGHTPITNHIIAKYIGRYIHTGYHPYDYLSTDNFKDYAELGDKIAKQCFFLPTLQDAPEDDIGVIIKSTTKRYTGIKNDDSFYLKLGIDKHYEKMSLINSLRDQNIIDDSIGSSFLSGTLKLNKTKIYDNPLFSKLGEDYKKIFTEMYINSINEVSN
tara:strand:+ start:14727 stop:15890 length:1164 start_codon:yes stop_codon:yes gene_type:complete